MFFISPSQFSYRAGISTSGTGGVGGEGAPGVLPTGRLSVGTAAVPAEDGIERAFEVTRDEHGSIVA